LSKNPNITWDIVRNNLDKSWVFEQLTLNPVITPVIIKNNPNILWDYQYFSKNPNITWNIVKDNLDKNWNYELLTWNPMTKAKDEFIIKYFQKWFSQSDLKRELMEKLWHPNNLERMQHNGFDIFDI
jgi:uncharacterized protein with HEPN domain